MNLFCFLTCLTCSYSTTHRVRTISEKSEDGARAIIEDVYVENGDKKREVKLKEQKAKKKDKPKRVAVPKNGPGDSPKPLTPKQALKQERFEENAFRARYVCDYERSFCVYMVLMIFQTMQSCYFNSETSKRIDFVLVTTTEICADSSKYLEIHSFLKNLIDVGILIEIEFGKVGSYKEDVVSKLYLAGCLAYAIICLYSHQINYIAFRQCSEALPDIP